MDSISANYGTHTTICMKDLKAFSDYLINHDLFPEDPIYDSEEFLNLCRPHLKDILLPYLNRNLGVNIWQCLHVTMEKLDGTESTPYFSHPRKFIHPTADLDDVITGLFTEMLKRQEDYQEKGSGWTVKNVEFLDVHLAPHAILDFKGGTHVRLPDELFYKRAIVNVKNEDDQCLKWAILSALHPIPGNKDPCQLYHYTPYRDELDFTAIDFPAPLQQVKTLEINNNLSINVYGYDDQAKRLQVLHLSERTYGPGIRKHIHLMYYRGHYSWIKHLSRLLHDTNGHMGRKFYCDRCLQPQWSAARLTQHIQQCQNHNPTRTTMPKKDFMKFKNTRRQLRSPYTIYADFETLLTPLHGNSPRPNTSSTTKTNQHTPCSYGLYEVKQCCGPDTRQHTEPKIYRGPDAVNPFLDTVLKLSQDHQERLDKPVPLKMTTDEKHQRQTGSYHLPYL